MRTNYHTHSIFCDGKFELEKWVDTAIHVGIDSLGFSSHAPLPLQTEWAMKEEDFPKYLTQILELKRKYEGQIELYSGLEVDYIPGIIERGFDYYQPLGLDYTIGAVHFVDQFPADQVPWGIDVDHTVFAAGLKKIFNNDVKKAISRYFYLIREMLQTATPTILAHIDRIKIHNTKGQFFREHDAWYKREVKATLQTIKSSGTILEVNTRGLYKHFHLHPYPSRWILEECLEMGIPLTLNSDAHHVDELIGMYDKALYLLHDIGYRELMILHAGVWTPVSLDLYWGRNLKYA